MGYTPAMMTWRVSKPDDSDFCQMGYVLSIGEDQLRPHDEETCEDIACAVDEFGVYDPDDIEGSVNAAFQLSHGHPGNIRTVLFTKKLWVPDDFDPTGMYEDLGFNYSSSTETARWLHHYADEQMSGFIDSHGCEASETPALKRNVCMFVINNADYLRACLDENGYEYDYAYLPDQHYRHEDLPSTQFAEQEKALLRV